MLRFLFPRLTKRQADGRALFDWAVAQARRPHWYLDGALPDTLEGRFAAVATIVALATVRADRGGDIGRDLSAGLTEQFVATMDSEHRQLGTSDPGIGKTVRKLVAVLGKKVGRWRDAVEPYSDWDAAVTDSLYGGTAPSPASLAHASRELKTLWERLEAASDAQLAQGDVP